MDFPSKVSKLHLSKTIPKVASRPNKNKFLCLSLKASSKSTKETPSSENYEIESSSSTSSPDNSKITNSKGISTAVNPSNNHKVDENPNVLFGDSFNISYNTQAIVESSLQNRRNNSSLEVNYNSSETISSLKDTSTSSEAIDEIDAFKEYASKLNDPSESKIIHTTEKVEPTEVLEATTSDFSQLLKDSQVLKQIDSVICGEKDLSVAAEPPQTNKRKLDDVDENFVFKIPRVSSKEVIESEGPSPKKLSEADSTSLEDIFTSTNIDAIFDQIETSICLMGTEQEDNNANVREEVVDLILKADPLNKSMDGSINWPEDSLFSGSAMNLSFGSAIKNVLLSNANKAVGPINEVDTSFATEPEQMTQNVYTHLGPFYGLPLKVKDLIKQYKGIDGLYDWQEECLKLPALEKKSNLIYALPTSGGKTLVAEILILKELLCYKKNVILVLPYVAIVQEKVWALSPFAVALDFMVEEYAGSKGSYPPRKRRRKRSVYIATIEKAHGLVNSLIENDRLNELGLIVVDELHLIGEAGRGCILEGLLTKLAYLKAKIQIVGMSATIGNLKDICEFLNSEMYTKNFRPVELTEYVKCGDEVAKVNNNCDIDDNLLTVVRKVDYNYSETIKNLDPDKLGGLVSEVIPNGSCLIFCASKKNCENVARLLSRILFKSLKDYKKQEKMQLTQALMGEAGSLCNVLKFSIPFGIAYHHSGLTSDERKTIEDGFRAGVISVICCTSTLAAGVNLPAQRVILRQPYIGRDFINLSRYKQMVGRAGRAGLGETGDSILLCSSQDLPKVRKLLLSPMDQALSSIHDDNGKGLRHLLLSCIALGIANTRKELHAVTRKTLCYVQQSKNPEVNLKRLTDTLIRELFIMGALQTTSHEINAECETFPDVSYRLETTLKSDESFDSQKSSKSTTSKKLRVVVSGDTKLTISKLGLAAIKGGFELSRAHILYEDLVGAQQGLVLLDSLHLLYLVTPYDLAEQIKPNMQTYYTIYSSLTARELQTAKTIGLTESVAVKMLSNQPIKNVPQNVLSRFYLTLLLYNLWNETPIFEASQKFQLDRGLVQNLMQSSASFASNVVNFCEVLDEFWSFAHLLKGMSLRLAHCCVKEILPLMELPAVKQSRARQLFNAGYKTLQTIAKANADDLVQEIEYMPKRVANQLIAAAKMLLLEKVENLREEAEDVMNGIDTKQLNMTMAKP